MTNKSAEGAVRETRHVVTSFLEHKGKILLVRRSQAVRTHQGLWAGISGYLEHPPLEQALIEIQEETGLNKEDVELRREGQSVDVPDPEHNIRWVVHPFLFHVKRPDTIRLDWENIEMRWILPAELGNYDTVPGLKDALASCQ
ncbi:MAG: NUDIX domain-containing protein [Acidiferrobacterales bacterium]